jgi:hypothetical protein
MAWNANSLVSKQGELEEFMKRKKIHACLVSETHLKPNKRYKQYKHVVYRNDRLTQGGGTAIIIRHDIQHHVIDLPQLNSIEATGVI